jgi:hypothetical protein
MKRRILIIAIGLLIIIQLIIPERNISSASFPNDISTQYVVPANVKQVLEKACDDCHSNNTNYPWYTNIQPVGWWLQHHVNEGKRELNFNEFVGYPLKKQDHKMEELIKTVKEGEMPINSYTWTHKNAKLSEQEKELLLNWAQEIRNKIIL